MMKVSSKAQLMAFSQPSYKAPAPCEKEARSPVGDYVAYGDHNRYPAEIVGLYNDVALMSALVNNTVDYMLGDDMVLRSDIVTKDTIKRTALDLVLFNAFSLQVSKNRLGEIGSVDYLDQAKVRFDKRKTVMFYSNDWTRRNEEIVKIPLWTGPDMQDDVQAYSYLAPCKNVYPTPF